jgi:hypothetical protein
MTENAMSNDNPDFQPYYQPGGWTHPSSTNAGADQARSGQPCSPQQSNESYASYATRQAAYDWTSSNQGR